MIFFHSLFNGRKIRGAVEGSTVRFQDDAGRNFLRVRLLLHIHYKRALALVGETFLFEFLHHAVDQILNIRLPFPQIKFHIQLIIISLDIRKGHIHDVLPERTVSAHAVLEFLCILQRALLIGFVHLALSAGRGVDLFQIRYGKRRFFRVFPFVAFIKIGKLRLPFLQLRNNLPHLQSPVTQVDISDHIVSRIAQNSFYALTDDCGTQMSHMQRLRHIGSAVVNDDGFLFLRLRHAEFFRRCHLVQITA